MLDTIYVEISAVGKFCRFCGFHSQFQDSENLICGNLSVCNNYRLRVVQFLLSMCFKNDNRVLLSKQLQHGYHVYKDICKDIWDPPVSEIVFCECENRNPRDPYAVALRKDSITVGHVLRAISCICTLFLKRGDTLLGKPSLSF